MSHNEYSVGNFFKNYLPRKQLVISVMTFASQKLTFTLGREKEINHTEGDQQSKKI